MDKNKKQIVMRLIIVLLVGMNFIFLMQSRSQKKFINSYIDLYSSQVLIKEDEKEKLISNKKIDKDFYKDYEYYLTEDFLNRLIKYDKMPAFDLIDYGIEKDIKSFKIVNNRIRGKGKNMFDAKYDLLLTDSKGNNISIHHEETYALKKEGKDYKINAIGIKVKNIEGQK